MAEKEGLIKGFKTFLLRGNAVDLAVAVVIGAAFGKVVTSLVENLITPILSAIVGKPDFRQSGILTINKSNFLFGSFFTDVLNFVLIAAAIYFFVVVPINRLMARFAAGEETVTAPDPQTELLREIRDLLAGVPEE